MTLYAGSVVGILHQVLHDVLPMLHEQHKKSRGGKLHSFPDIFGYTH